MATSTAILSSAYTLFTRRGYHGTSMRLIAKEAGVALGGIYNHFPSKEEIFREVVLAYHPYHEILPAIVNAHHETLEGLFRQAARLIDGFLNARPEVLNLMFIEVVEFDGRHMPELLERIIPEVSRTILQLQQSGHRFRPMPVPMVLRVFIGTILGYVITKHLLGRQGGASPLTENALDHFVDVFLHGIQEPKPA